MHEISLFWFGYLVPSLWGNGPEALAQTIVYGLIAIAVIPPARHFVERHVEGIKAHVTAEHAAVHEKLDHVIRHSKDIPDFHPKKASEK